jgi:hypothetical protein
MRQKLPLLLNEERNGVLVIQKKKKERKGWINGRVQSVVMFMTRLKEILITVWHQEQPGKMFHMIGYVLFAGLPKVILL